MHNFGIKGLPDERTNASQFGFSLSFPNSPGTISTCKSRWISVNPAFSAKESKLRSSKFTMGSVSRGQCRLNKKNVAEVLLFEGKALLSWSLAMETGIGTLDDTRVKTETAWRQQCSRFAQICEQALLQSGKLLPGDQGKGKAGGV
jgi:hypothetical protein